MLWHYIIIGLVCLFVGFWLGGKNGRRVKRSAMLELNTNSLNLLETKSRYSGTDSQQADYQRKDKLLQLTLQQLKDANACSKASDAESVKYRQQADLLGAHAVRSDAKVVKLQKDLIAFTKHRNNSQWALKSKIQHTRNLAVEAHLKALKATSLARKATSHLKKVEDIISSQQRRPTASQQSHLAGRQVTLSVVDKPGARSAETLATQVPSRDSVRRTNLDSSNEAVGPLN